MKKWIAMLLALAMMMSLAACGEKEDSDKKDKNNKKETTAALDMPGSALEILEVVWGKYADEEKFFAIGGDYTNPIDNAPGVFSLEEPENVTAMLLVPQEQQSNVDAAASLMHAMLPNNFTCGVFHMTGDAAAFAKAMYEAVSTNPWMCGMPETLFISSFGSEYVLVAFGINDAMNPFLEKLTAEYPGMTTIYNETITG